MHAKLKSLLLAALALSLCGSAHAQNYPEVLFVFDSSGSMLESAGSTTKIVAAKQVMNQIVPELSSKVRVGLIAYGHRRKGDCGDIEVLIPPGSNDRVALLQRLQSLQPRGLTPITDALSTAIDLLKLKESETSIILVSDGKETCHGDPCGVVTKLKATGINFVLHVVGFQVDQQARNQLQCLAKEGGGQYFHAGNPDGLLKSLQEIEKQIEVEVRVAAKAPPIIKKPGLGNIVLTQPESATVSMHGLQIVRTKDEKVIKTTERLPATSKHLLPDGEYAVNYLYAQSNYGTPVPTKLGTVQVKRGTPTTIAMGAIAFNIDPTLQSDAPVEKVLVVDSGTQQPAAVVNYHGNIYYHFRTKAVLAGVYDVQFVYSRSPDSAPTVVARQVSVTAGKTTTVTLDSGIRLKAATATAVTGWDLIPHRAVADTNEGEGTPDEPAPILQVRRRSDNQYPLWKAFVVPSGHYRLLVHIKSMDEPLELDDDLEINAGQLIDYDAGL